MTPNPTITNPNELEWRLLYSMIVAGKNAKFADAAMARLLRDGWAISPFLYLKPFAQAPAGPMWPEGAVEVRLMAARTGNYSKLARAIKELIAAKLDLATCTIAQLEAIHGIGPKTARFFLLWTRQDARCAALDVHVLRWLRERGVKNVPTASPPKGPTYARLEALVLAEADRRGITSRELDYEIWSAANVGGIT